MDLLRLAFDLSKEESESPSIESLATVSSRPVEAANNKSGTSKRLFEVSASFMSYVLQLVHKTAFSSGSPII